MSEKELIVIPNLGPCGLQSPLRRDARGTMEGTFVTDSTYVRLPIEIDTSAPGSAQLFEKAGPREKIFFDPARTKAAIVTCGGLCPGLNNVIRSVYLQLHFHYGVNAVLGIRYGFSGFAPEAAASPVWLNTEMVNDIHQRGGTLLGSSRG
ncbi:MAG TPA: 6-phosphofructokinase, partial [Terriglobales bacterium]